MSNPEQIPTHLIDLLCNSIVLRQLCPYIPISGLLHLSATCKSIQELIYTRPEPWRYVDLSTIKSTVQDSSPIDVGGVTWRAERMDENLTEDEFYAGPLRGILNNLHKRKVLGNVHTLILDGLSVPADLVREIVSEDRYNVRILSLRNAKHLNLAKLQQVLRYSVRPSRAEGTPKLKALYCFEPLNPELETVKVREMFMPDLGVITSEGAQIGSHWDVSSAVDVYSFAVSSDEERWMTSSGRLFKQRPQSDWPDTLQACKDIIAFDAVLCRGPRHNITKVDSRDFLQPSIATIALGPRGCEICGACPENPACFGTSPESSLPLLRPVPLHSSTLRAAQCPERGVHSPNTFIARCEDCLRGRWCEQCNRWWCEDCYKTPVSRAAGRNDPNLNISRDHGGSSTSVKVYLKRCVEHCLRREMMEGAGSNGMWG